MPLRLQFFAALTVIALADEPSTQARAPVHQQARVLVDLRVEPRLISPYDRSLLESSSYSFPQDGSVRDPGGRALVRPELLEALEALRATRRREGLAVFESAQQALLKNNGRLPPEQQGKIQFVLARDWETIPPDIRGGMNELLSHGGAQTVASSDLAWVRSVQKAWEKGEPFGYEPGPGSDTPGLVRPNLPGGLGSGPHYMPRPPPEDVARRFQELTGQAASYAPEVNESLRLIASHASAEDWEAVRRFLKTGTPIWYSNEESFPYSSGAAWTPTGFPDHERDGKPSTRIVMPEYAVGVNNSLLVGAQTYIRRSGLPHPHASYYERKGLPVPQLMALDPAQKGLMIAGGFEQFSDGSFRKHPSARDRAGTLFHEILHIDTHHGLGAGVNAWANERRSFAGGNRLEHNWNEANGGAQGNGRGDQWLHRPVDYWNNKLADYMGPEVGEVRSDEVTVKDHLKRIEWALSARGEEFERLRQEELNRHLKRYEDMDAAIIRDLQKMRQVDRDQALEAQRRSAERFRSLRESPEFKNWDFRAHLLRERQELLKDQELSVRVFLDDWKWHESRGFPYGEPQRDRSAPIMRINSAEPPLPVKL